MNVQERSFPRQQVATAKLPEQVLAKWSPGLLTEGFVPFPKKTLRTMHRILPGANGIKELAVLLAVVDFKRPNQLRVPSMDYLAFLAGLDEKEFETILGELQTRGLIQVAGDRNGLEISLDGFHQAVEREAR